MQIGRVGQITKIFFEEGLGFLTRQAGELRVAGGDEGTAPEPGASALADREIASRLRRTLERLGPTFVKFGQMLATRVDLFSEDFIEELGKLHSKVPPFPHATAVQIVEQELECPLDEVFAEFPTTPVASASVAQVYRARLRDSGREVAVKVQRPNLEESLLRDLEILVQMSGWLDALVPAYRRSLMHLVAKEYAHRARMEINFVREAKAMERFGELLADDPYFRVPEVVAALTKERLIVMEWFDGKKLDEVSSAEALRQVGFSPEELCRNLLRLQVCMAYEFGFVHGDTHPGNLILMPSGKLGLIDFGLHSDVSKSLRDKMVEALSYQSRGDIDRMVDALVEVAPPAAASSLPAYKSDLKQALASEIEAGNSLSDNKISAQLIIGVRIGAKYKNRAQPDLLIIVRNLAIVEGIVLRFHPDLKPNEELKAIIAGILRRRFTPEALQEQMRPLLMDLAVAMSRRPETVERLLRLERRFVEAADLGDFLRREGVLRSPEGGARGRVAWMLAAGAGLLIGAVVAAFLGLHL